MSDSHCSSLFTLMLIFFVMMNCSKSGYIEVRNKSEAMIENVRWGNIVELGPIEVGQEAGKETERHESHRIYFKKNGEEYMSKKIYTVDARTSATYTHKDTSDVEVAE